MARLLNYDHRNSHSTSLGYTNSSIPIRKYTVYSLLLYLNSFWWYSNIVTIRDNIVPLSVISVTDLIPNVTTGTVPPLLMT